MDCMSLPIGMLGSLFGGPWQTELVGEDASREGGAVVASPPDKHHTQFRYMTGRLDAKHVGVWRNLHNVCLNYQNILLRYL